MKAGIMSETDTTMAHNLPPPPPALARDRYRKLEHWRQVLLAQRAEECRAAAAVADRLAVADAVRVALDELSQQLFGDITRAIEHQLTLALREVLEQPLAL